MAVVTTPRASIILGDNREKVNDHTLVGGCEVEWTTGISREDWVELLAPTPGAVLGGCPGRPLKAPGVAIDRQMNGLRIALPIGLVPPKGTGSTGTLQTCRGAALE